VAAFALLITEWLRNDIVAALIVLALAGTGLLTPAEALAGFSSEPAIVVAAIFVLSGALHQTGLADAIGGLVARLAGGGLTRANAVIMPAVAALSAFTHHVTTAWGSSRSRRSASRSRSRGRRSCCSRAAGSCRRGPGPPTAPIASGSTTTSRS
jgi:di/tricarboxylate transporter